MGAADVAIKVLRFLGKGLLSFLLVMLLYFVAALIGSAIPVNTDQPEYGDITIYLRTNGVHTDYVFPVKTEVIDWTEVVDPETILSTKENFRFISFGWGDLEFYKNTPEWADLEFPVAFQAVFLESPSALHVQYQENIRLHQPAVPVEVTKEQYERLVTHVLNTFKRDVSRNVRPVENLHYNQHDAFFHAWGSLHFFYTCNTWVNEGLKKSGLRACLWTPFDDGIFFQYL